MTIASPLTMAPLILAAVLVISAIAKVRAPASTTSSITLLQLPAFLRTDWFARALPIGEIVLAIVMTSPFTLLVRAASVASLVLFAAYLVVIVRAMGFSPRPSCGCFGNIGDQRVNGRTVARNVLFVALALVFVGLAFTGHTVPGELATFGAVGWVWVLMAIALAAVAVFITGGTFEATGAAPARHQHDHSAHATTVTRSGDDDAWSDDDDYVRAPIPRSLLLTPEGEPVLLTELAQQRAQLLVFGNCYCGSTIMALTETEGWAQRVPAIDVHYVFSGVPPLDVHSRQPAPGWRDHAGLTWQSLQLQASPAAVLLGADGMLAGGPVSGIEEIRAFVDDIADALSDAEPEFEGDAPGADTVVEGELVTKD